ncbi:MAG: hypothetical protein ACQGVK_00110 [Myxococcota bacterium]
MTEAPSASPKPGPERRPGAVLGLWAVGLLVLDAVYLHWVWRSFPDWGIWDWDLQASILEVARLSILGDGEWPTWDRFRGGGWTLVGNPLARTFNPSFLPVLVLGTWPGIKVALLAYLWIAQVGFLGLGRQLGLGLWPSLLGGLVFAWSGCFAQHLTHGHYEWLGYAWLPWVLWALHRSWERATPGRLAAAGVALALLWLDGGPYQLLFTILFVALYSLSRSIAVRSLRPAATAVAVGVAAAWLAAVQLWPVVETARRIPRPTAEATRYFGMDPLPSASEVLFEGLLSRDQRHDAEAWMPFRINVGMYVGVLPLLLGAFALARRRHGLGWLAAVLGASLWFVLSEELPIAPWGLLHRLPGFASLQVPARFNLFVVASLALLAAHGLQALAKPRRLRPVGPLVVALVAADLFWVNAPVFEAAFPVPPMEVEPRPGFVQYLKSPYGERYAKSVRYPVRPNWPNATYPAILENAGVIYAYRDLVHGQRAIAFDAPDYPGAEVVALASPSLLRSFELTANRVKLALDGTGGRIVVNQNFHPDWKVLGGEGARIAFHEGRLAVDVPRGVHSAELVFRPRSFVLGAVASASGWIAVAGIAVYSRYPRARSAS